MYEFLDNLYTNFQNQEVRTLDADSAGDHVGGARVAQHMDTPPVAPETDSIAMTLNDQSAGRERFMSCSRR